MVYLLNVAWNCTTNESKVPVSLHVTSNYIELKWAWKNTFFSPTVSLVQREHSRNPGAAGTAFCII